VGRPKGAAPPFPPIASAQPNFLTTLASGLGLMASSSSSPAKRLGKAPSTSRRAGGGAVMQEAEPNPDYAALPSSALDSHPLYAALPDTGVVASGALAAFQQGMQIKQGTSVARCQSRCPFHSFKDWCTAWLPWKQGS
jgi:hypothetical protein